jgi:hypothetical protein
MNTQKKLAVIIVSLCFVFSFNSCKSPFGEDFGEIIRTGNIIEGTGTVTFLDFEGGFYGIITANNGNWDPINLPSSYQINGLKVKFKAKIRNDFVSYHMWGTGIEIIHIRKAD